MPNENTKNKPTFFIKDVEFGFIPNLDKITGAEYFDLSKYGQDNETLHNLMIEIAQLSVSRVFLFKEQTYRGRCLVAYKDHVNDLNELSDEERNAFMADVVRVTRAMDKAFHPEKINYGAFYLGCR